MPIVDYAEWFRQQQQRQGMGGMPGATGSLIAPGSQPVGFQAPRFGEIDREMGNYTKDVAIAGAKGYAAAGPIGAVINAGIAAAPTMARAGRRAWDAAKEGNTEATARSLAPVSPYFYLNAKTGGKNVLEMMGMPSWTNPFNLAVKGVAELFGGPLTRVEEKRWERLKDYGFEVPKWAQGNRELKFDAFRQDLPPDYVGYDKAGNWVNNRFAKSRQEVDLTPTDVSQTAAMAETFGLPYQKASQQTRDAMANIALQNKLIREEKGTMSIAWDQDKYKQAADILMQDKGAQQYLASQPREYVSKLKFKGIE
jgi:hypothetical protein